MNERMMRSLCRFLALDEEEIMGRVQDVMYYVKRNATLENGALHGLAPDELEVAVFCAVVGLVPEDG